MASSSVQLHGFKALDDMLREMPNAVAGKQLTAAARKGATVIAAEARRLAPRGSGELADKGIKVRRKRGGVATGVTLKIGTTAKVFWARFVELGTKAHLVRVRKKGVLVDVPNRRFFGPEVRIPAIGPRPFLRPALDNKGLEAIEVMRVELARRCEAVFRNTMTPKRGR